MILWISTGSGGGFAKALHQSHPTVLFYDWGWAREKHLYEGLMPQVQHLENGLAMHPDAVLFESTGNGELADRLRSWCPVWGAGRIQDVLERNRGFCVKLADACGLTVPRTVIFDPQASSWLPDTKNVQTIRGWVNEAVAFAQKERGTRFVIKPYDSDSSATTYIADGVEDLVDRLKDLQEEQQIPEGSPFILQEVIEGLELSTEVWLQDGDIVPGSPNHTIELKKAWPGDLGPTVGSASSTVWFPEYSTIVNQIFGGKKIQEWLQNPIDHKGQRHRPFHGPLDFNAIIGQDGRACFLESTPRPGWLTYYALIQLLPEKEIGDLFLRVAQGRLDRLPSNTKEYAYEICLSTPPYPTTEEISTEKNLGREYRGILDHATGVKISGPVTNPAIYWIDVRANQKTGQLEQAGTFGQIASITGHDRQLERARDSAHDVFTQLRIPEKQGRIIDGADRALETLPKLKKLGVQVPS